MGMGGIIADVPRRRNPPAVGKVTFERRTCPTASQCDRLGDRLREWRQSRAVSVSVNPSVTREPLEQIYLDVLNNA